MLQIIGWLGCAMLAVKLLEISGNPTLQNERGEPRSPIVAALWVGWASVFGFAFWLAAQGGNFPHFETSEERTEALRIQADEAEATAELYEQRLRDAGVEAPK